MYKKRKKTRTKTKKEPIKDLVNLVKRQRLLMTDWNRSSFRRGSSIVGGGRASSTSNVPSSHSEKEEEEEEEDGGSNGQINSADNPRA